MTHQSSSDGSRRQSAPTNGRLLVGLALVAAGVSLFVAPAVGLRVDGDVFAVGWPFLVVGFGLALLVGSPSFGRRAERAAVVGGVVFGAGVVLTLQNASGDWDVWYVWPLAAFGGAGLGRVAHGLFAGDANSLRGGGTLAAAGLGLAVLGAAIEGDLTTTVVAAALVVAGLAVVIFGGRRRPAPATGATVGGRLDEAVEHV
jgi:hypothetical protein